MDRFNNSSTSICRAGTKFNESSCDCLSLFCCSGLCTTFMWLFRFLLEVNVLMQLGHQRSFLKSAHHVPLQVEGQIKCFRALTTQVFVSHLHIFLSHKSAETSFLFVHLHVTYLHFRKDICHICSFSAGF